MSRICRYRQINFKSEINLVPLLDVFLVLLIIFMIALPSSIISNAIDINLTDATTSRVNSTNHDNSTVIIIEISKLGEYTMIVNYQNRINKLLPEQIVTKIKHYIQLNPNIMFLVSGSKDISYNEIIKVLNLLNSIGIKTVGLTTTQPI